MKTITAIGMDGIDYEFLQASGYEIIGRDIIYQEGIFETLEIYKSTEAIILSDVLPGELSFEELIKKIVKKYDKIDITVFLEHEDYNKNIYLNSFGIYKIYSLEKYKEEIGNSIKEESNYDFKEILRKSIKKADEYSNTEFVVDDSKSKVIVIDGIRGGGKTTLACLIAGILADKEKVLVIDMDNHIKSVNTITGQSGVFIKYRDFDIQNICDLETFENSGVDKELKKIQFYKFFEKIRNLYDFIIIDGEESGSEIQKMLFEYANIILFIAEPSIISLKKAKIILEEYEEIYCSKIKIVLNKSTQWSIKNSLVEKMFSKYEIIENISFSELIELVINKNLNKKININEINRLSNRIKEELQYGIIRT
ncbi:MAG: hypothetical protein K6D97_08605 [Clostridia bacterium]|nr:hypothetical protein [Clostridia bacterium]